MHCLAQSDESTEDCPQLALMAVAITTAMPYYYFMRTVAETAIFQRYADEIWSEEERLEFITWIALNPSAGALVPGSGGCRKVRWSRAGQGVGDTERDAAWTRIKIAAKKYGVELHEADWRKMNKG